MWTIAGDPSFSSLQHFDLHVGLKRRGEKSVKRFFFSCVPQVSYPVYSALQSPPFSTAMLIALTLWLSGRG